MRSLFVAAVVFGLTGCVSSATTTPTSALPLKRLRLYETGVGYFERSGLLSRDEHAGLPIPAGHLDDALKTLVVLTPGGKAATEGVEFGSSLSHGMARAMAGLPLEDDNAAVTYEVLLASLKGSRVEVRALHRTVTGRLVDVETVAGEVPEAKDDAKDDAKSKHPKPPHIRLTVLTDRAEVVHVEGADVASVRPTDSAQAARLDAALEALLAHGASHHHLLQLLGKPGSPVTLGYVAETPVWRTTYRLVIGSDARATLQAWALLHNDTDENWQNVQVELVNGRPDSFLFPLAAPRYARRELITPKNELSTVPQLMGNTVDTLWGDHAGETSGSLGLSGIGEGGGGYGEGIGLGNIGTIGHGKGDGSGIGESSLLEVGDLASVAQAKGVESGALFVYSMPAPIALRAHASALVPFVQQTVEAEPIAWFESPGTVARSAVRFINSTAQTLPPGTIAFFSGGGFSGESAIDRLRPNERRFLTFGVDLDAVAKEADLRVDDQVERLTFSGDRLEEHFRRTTDSEWTLENRSGSARTMIIALGIDRNATLKGVDALDYDVQTNRALATFRVPARQEQKRKTTSVEGLSRHTALSSLSAQMLTSLAALPSLAAHDKPIATEAASKQKELEDVRVRMAAQREEQKTLEGDLARLREDAKAVGDRGPLTQPLVVRIVAAEDRIGVVRKHIDELAKDETKRVDAVRLVLLRLVP